MNELDKYRGIYAEQAKSNPGRWARYGHSNHGREALRFLEKCPPKSLVDVGCGHNEFAKAAAAKWGIRAVGVDFACPSADLIAPATALPFEDDGRFDVATSFDMFEHLPESEVDQAMAEMARVSDRFIVSIAYVDSVNRWNGQTLHPTVRPREWWVNRLVRAGALKIGFHGRFIHGEWSHNRLTIPAGASVLMIGNGPGAVARPMGPVVDAFDEVVRFNNYKIEGFERQVGTKTTLWSSFFRRIDNPLAHYRVICPHETDTPPDSVREKYHISGKFFDWVRQMILDRAYWKSGFTFDPEKKLLPTSGLLLASYLLEIVGVETIHLLGFDHFSKERSGGHHYWMRDEKGGIKTYKKPAEHDGDIEAQIFRDWEKAGRVVYL